MLYDNILLITDEEEVAQSVLSKLVLLRESDSIAVCDYKSARRVLKTPSISVVIVHECDNREKTLNLLKEIKSPDYEIILLVNSYDQKFILTAYDCGITDYFSVESESYEMLIRTINSFKIRSLRVNFARNCALLKLLCVVDDETGFYKYKFCKELLAETITDPKIQNGMFVILALDEECKTRFSADKLSKAIKASVRYDDIVSVVKGGKFYLILPNIDKIGAISVVNKIQDILDKNLVIRAGICKIADNAEFEKLEKSAFSALSEACQAKETAVIFEKKNDSLDTWLEDDEKDDKNFKLFKNAYNNKLEKVITPVFFRLQKAYEEKLFNTKITQYTDEFQSVFRLVHDGRESRLKITYPGFAKIVIYISHDGLDTPDNREIELKLNEVTPKEISAIVENFIKEFKSTIKD